MRISGLSSRAIIGTFYQTLEGAFDKSWVSKIGMLFTSDMESETYKWLGMSPQMREWIGPRLAKGLRTNGITIENKTYESTLQINVDDLRRDKTDQIMLRVREMADRTADHWEKLLSALIAAGDGSTLGLAYDGQYFFDTDHSEGDSGTLVNSVSSSHVAKLNVTTAADPTEAEMAAAILGMVAYQYGYKDDQGEPMNGAAREFVVMCPVNLWGAAMAAASKDALVGASGAISPNPLASSGVRIIPVCNPRLSTTTVFYMFRTDGRAKPFILQEELPVQVSAIAEGSEEEFKHNQHLYGVKAIRNVGFGLWQHAMMATLS
jgi:phage major head subunit gpT-like protein